MSDTMTSSPSGVSEEMPDYPMERVSSHSRELDAALAALTDSGAVSQAAVRNLAPDVELAPLFAT